MKKIFACALLIFNLTFFAGSAFAATFPDVPDNTVNNMAVEFLKLKGIINGYPDGTFQPDKTINRAEALKIVMLAVKILSQSGIATQETASTQQIIPDKNINFPDVPSGDWFYEYVKNAYGLEIIEGYPDGKFKPANNINIAESIKIIEMAFGADLPSGLTENPYPDVDKNVWYASNAAFAKTRQIIWPLDDGKLHAERDITRGEFAQIIYRLIYIRENKLEAFPISNDWPVFAHPTEHFTIKYPFGWKQISADKQTIFWKQDLANNQISFARIYPNSASVTIARDLNKDQLSLNDYLSRIQYDQSAVIKKLTLNTYPFASVTITSQGITDYYFEFPDKSILVLYSQAGSGMNKTQLTDQIRYMAGSIKYVESSAAGTVLPDPNQQFLTGVRKNILIAGKGEETIKLFDDLVIIETDTIGIGTGPVDYYYSAKYNVTLKYERNSNVILAIQESKTTAF
jgi:hypothetical protein